MLIGHCHSKSNWCVSRVKRRVSCNLLFIMERSSRGFCEFSVSHRATADAFWKSNLPASQSEGGFTSLPYSFLIFLLDSLHSSESHPDPKRGLDHLKSPRVVLYPAS